MPDDQLDLLVAYLRQHGDRFVVEALRKQMLSEGHDPALVEQAIQIYQAERPAPPPRPLWPLALGIAFANLALCVVAMGSLAIFEGMSEPVATAIVLPLLAILGLEPVVGAVLILAGGPRRRPGMGLLLGWVLFVGATLLLVGGFCLFFIASGYN